MFSIGATVQVHALEKSGGIRWVEFLPPWDDAAPTATDMSFLLDPPAGKHGRVVVCGEHLCFEDGTRARFWGVNIHHGLTVPSKDNAEKYAGRFAKLGFNAVRVVAIDNVGLLGGLLYPSGTTQYANSLQALDKFDYLMYQLIEHGIYFRFVLNGTGASPLLELSSLPQKHELSREFGGGGKTINLLDPSLRFLQREFARQLLQHVNQYTGRAYADEPALIGLELTNENSLVCAWGQGDIDKLPSYFQTSLKKSWTIWITKKYGSIDAALAKWFGQAPATEGLMELKGLIPRRNIPGQGSDGTLPFPLRNNHAGNIRMLQDWFAFLGEQENQHFGYIIEGIRDAGFRGPVITTQNCGLPGDIRPFLPDEIVDAHAYWDHPRNRQGGQQGEITNRAMVDSPSESTVALLSLIRLMGRPFTIGEYNHPYPNRHAAEAAPLIGAYGAFQDWDGIFWYNYVGHLGNRPYVEGFFTLERDASKLVTFPLGAAFFLRDMEPALSEVVLCARKPSSEAVAKQGPWFRKSLFDELGLDWSWALRAKVTVLPLLADECRLHQKVTASSSSVQSQGNIRWTVKGPNPGLVSIITKRSVAIVGFLGGHHASAGPLAVTLPATDEKPFATTVGIVSLDGKPVSSSRRVLLIVAGSTRNRGMQWDDTETSVIAWGDGPPEIATFAGGQVKLGLDPRRSWRAWTLDATGRRIKEIPVIQNGSQIMLTLPSDSSPWYELSADL